MKYISWAVLYEGPSDALYLDILIPRTIRGLIAAEGVALVDIPDTPAVTLGRDGRAVDKVAREACEAREAFDLLFIHADTGGRHIERGLENRSAAYCEAIGSRCDWPGERCVTISPRHETEAWLLADDGAVANSLGYRGAPAAIGLPADAMAAERLGDPKQLLAEVIAAVAGRRRSQHIDILFPAIAQRQDLTRMRRSPSFRAFEDRLRAGLRSLGQLR